MKQISSNIEQVNQKMPYENYLFENYPLKSCIDGGNFRIAFSGRS
jgi:hypothetical protein